MGTVIRLDGPDAPAGYLKLDGGQYARADYPALVAFYQGQGRLIAGDTGAQFKVPDYRGRFDRAWSTAAGLDPDGPRAPGSTQADAFKSHTHTIKEGSNAPGPGQLASGDDYTDQSTYNQTTSSTGGTETRPVNVAFLWCIKT